MCKNMIRTRYAPSPTGALNVGGARTALFNYLFARQQGGKFVLRIEDTDLERSDKKYEKDIFESLRWLGIEADESPEQGGSYAPYRQSERTPIYQKYIEKLLGDGLAFYCFHSETELENEKNELMSVKKPVLHLCEYRSMDPKEAEILKDAKREYILRFKTPLGRKIVFQDLIRGELSFESDLLGDFSIAKRPDLPLYNFAVVADDETMKISHVIRGEDHISNTPKQILLIEALGFQTPQYAHLPLILGTDRSKLSKRHGAAGVSEYRAEGYLSDALFNFMALLGWSPGNDREILSQEELIREFSLERVQKSGAIFDTTKLEWMNGYYIRQKSVKELIKLCTPFLEEVGLMKAQSARFASEARRVKRKAQKEYLEKIIALEQPRLKKLSELPERVDYFFRAPKYEKDLLRWKDMSDEELRIALQEILLIFKDYAKAGGSELEKTFFSKIGSGDKGRLLWPLRAALSGKKASPGPFEIIAVLGVEEAQKRVKTASALL